MKICPECKEQKPLDDFTSKVSGKLRTYCKQCNSQKAMAWQVKNKERYQKTVSQRRRSRVSNGLCRICAEQSLLNKGFCEFHYVTDISSHSLGKCDKETVLILLKRFKENPFCPYTGEKLVLGINAHLDHTKSQKNHPELKGDIDNVEWISEQANLSKNGFNKEEFIQFCKLIASRFEPF